MLEALAEPSPYSPFHLPLLSNFYSGPPMSFVNFFPGTGYSENNIFSFDLSNQMMEPDERKSTSTCTSTSTTITTTLRPPSTSVPLKSENSEKEKATTQNPKEEVEVTDKNTEEVKTNRKSDKKPKK